MKRWYCADAKYWSNRSSPPKETPRTEEFLIPYAGFILDGEANPTPFLESPEDHTYSFFYRGQGRTLSLELKPPFQAIDVARELRVTIEPVPKEDRTLIPELAEVIKAEEEAARRAEERRQEAERQAQVEAQAEARRREQDQAILRTKLELARLEAEQRHAQEQRWQEEQAAAQHAHHAEREYQTRLQQLHNRYGGFPHYEAEAWIETYAQKYRRELLCKHKTILEAHAALHEDTAFIDRLKTQAPHIYTRATWEYRALAVATRIDAEQPRPRPKPTPEQVTQQMVRRFKIKLQDQEAVLKAGQAWLEEREEDLLSEIDDEEEREQMRQHLRSVLGQAIGDLNRPKEDGNGKVV